MKRLLSRRHHNKHRYIFILFSCSVFMIQAIAQEPSEPPLSGTQNVRPMPAVAPEYQLENYLTRRERAEGFILMFDGKSATDWRSRNAASLPVNWTVQKGHLYQSGTSDEYVHDNSLDGTLIYAQEIENATIKFEWNSDEDYIDIVLGELSADAQTAQIPKKPSYQHYRLQLKHPKQNQDWYKSELHIVDGLLSLPDDNEMKLEGIFSSNPSNSFQAAKHEFGFKHQAHTQRLRNLKVNFLNK